jgi:hypothetical protein
MALSTTIWPRIYSDINVAHSTSPVLPTLDSTFRPDRHKNSAMLGKKSGPFIVFNLCEHMVIRTTDFCTHFSRYLLPCHWNEKVKTNKLMKKSASFRSFKWKTANTWPYIFSCSQPRLRYAAEYSATGKHWPSPLSRFSLECLHWRVCDIKWLI